MESSSNSTPTPVPAEPKKKMALWKKILIGIGVFIFVLYLLGRGATSGITSIGDKEMKLLKSGDIQGAYALTSDQFRKATPYDKFIEFVNEYPILTSYDKYSFSDKTVDAQGVGDIKGSLKAKDGTVSELELRFAKEGSDWKILGISVTAATSAGTPGVQTNLGSQQSAAGLNQTFEDQNLGFSVKYPKEWSYEKVGTNGVAFTGPKNATVQIMNLPSKTRGGQFDEVGDVVKNLKKQIKQMDAKTADVSDGQAFSLKRNDGMELFGTYFVAAYKYQGAPVKDAYIIIPHGDGLTFHEFVFSAPIAVADEYIDIASAMADSMQIVK